MKVYNPNKPSQSGMALLVTLFLCLILSVTIAGYLKHSRQQHYLSMRSQVWNTSIAVTEAGLEEGLAHLNANWENLGTEGWVQNGNTYTLTRHLNDYASYTAKIDATSLDRPIITAQANVSAPWMNQVASAPMFAVINTTLGTGSTNAPISRAVRIHCGRDGLFLKALVAKYTINLNGNNVMTDSFNSTDPNYSDNGKYPAGEWYKLLDGGDVASDGDIVNVINVGNADIFGHVAVGPGGTISLGDNGAVGSHAWQYAGNLGVQLGWFSDNMNFSFPSIDLPDTTGWLTPGPGTVNTTNYNVVYATVATLPVPQPDGTITNVLTSATSSKLYPAPGTYVGTVSVQGNKYYYDLITGTNYSYPTLSTNTTVTSQTFDYVLTGAPIGTPATPYAIDTIKTGSIYVSGNVKFVVKGDFSLGGVASDNQLTIASDGKLVMYVGGTSCNFSGNGVVNQTGYAQNMVVWCTDNVKSLTLNGNGEFSGVIWAPCADVSLNGGGSSDQDFIGSLVANTITLNGSFSFHYDEALRNLDDYGRYKVTQWDEISVAQSGF